MKPLTVDDLLAERDRVLADLDLATAERDQLKAENERLRLALDRERTEHAEHHEALDHVDADLAAARAEVEEARRLRELDGEMWRAAERENANLRAEVERLREGLSGEGACYAKGTRTCHPEASHFSPADPCPRCAIVLTPQPDTTHRA